MKGKKKVISESKKAVKTKIKKLGKLLVKRHSTKDMLAIKTVIVEIRSFRELIASTMEAYKKGEMN